jgi:hypothetical protein
MSDDWHRYSDFELGEILAGDETRVELTQCVPDRQRSRSLFLGNNHDLDAFEEKGQADERIAELIHLTGAVDRRLSEIEWSEDIDGLEKMWVTVSPEDRTSRLAKKMDKAILYAS